MSEQRTWSQRTPLHRALAVVFGIASLVIAHAQLPGAALSGAADATGTNATASLSGEAAVKAAEARLAQARGQLASALNDASLTNAPAGVAPQDIWVRRALMHRLVRLYEQQLSNLAELDTTRTRKAEIAREAQAWTRFSEPLPYSILLTDRLEEELAAERLNMKNGEASTAMLDQMLDDNRRTLTQAEEKVRQFNEQLEGTMDPAPAARLSWQRELERLRSQVAAASLAVLDGERLIQQEKLATSRLRVGLLQRQLVIGEAGASFTQADLDQVTARLEGERERLERELAEAQTRRQTALQGLEAAREESRRAPDLATGGPVATRAAELVSARQAQLEAAETSTSILRQMLEGVNVERAMWELRFATSAAPSAETLRESARRLGIFARRLDLWREFARQRSDVASSQIQLQEARLAGLAPESELAALARERLEALREREQLQVRFLHKVESLERLIQRWEEGLRVAEGKLPITSRVRNLFSDARSFLQRFWTFELFTAEDTITVDGQKITGKRAVTIGKLVLAVLILVVGYWVTGLIALVVEPIIVKRLKIEAHQANLIRRWLRALLVLGLVLFSLVSVKIPLTVFAFAGGALAIGLGFGMQTLLKNFVSGIIILFERPFRVGDVLDVSGQKGSVTSIGLRASVLQLWDGTETLIPNSALLENNLTNWTYSDRRVRFAVSVGVAYGSDPRRVMELMNEVAERHGLVTKEPKPQVLFTQFGDSTLTFELRFWVDVSQANAAQVSSDLRLMIASSFAEHGITIDYPQRDVHLHAARPIQVEVVPVAAPAAGNGPGTAPAASPGPVVPAGTAKKVAAGPA